MPAGTGGSLKKKRRRGKGGERGQWKMLCFFEGRSDGKEKIYFHSTVSQDRSCMPGRFKSMVLNKKSWNTETTWVKRAILYRNGIEMERYDLERGEWFHKQ